MATANLSWQNNTNGATDIVVERSTDGAGFVVLATITGGSVNYSDDLGANTGSFAYRVKAINANTGASSVYSNEATVEILAAPTGLTATVS